MCYGIPGDARDYKVAARMISLLGIRSVLLLTNNPAKIDGLEHEGVLVSGRVPLVIRANPYDAAQNPISNAMNARRIM